MRNEHAEVQQVNVPWTAKASGTFRDVGQLWEINLNEMVAHLASDGPRASS